jgi:hypothetical protein
MLPQLLNPLFDFAKIAPKHLKTALFKLFSRVSIHSKHALPLPCLCFPLHENPKKA